MNFVPKSESGLHYQPVCQRQILQSDSIPTSSVIQHLGWRQEDNPQLVESAAPVLPETASKPSDMVVQLSQNNFQQISSVMHPQQHQTNAMLVDSNISTIENSPGSSTASNADISADGNSGSCANGDAEGVWSADIDQAFHEALEIYPPCGRRKIILSDEGKMYGRNELIARYIKLRCGKTRTRKQVSSHIQVLARKKQREVHSKVKVQDSTYNGSDFDCNEEGLNIVTDYTTPTNRIIASDAPSPGSACLDISATTSMNTSMNNGSKNSLKLEMSSRVANSPRLDVSTKSNETLLSTMINRNVSLPFSPATAATTTAAAAALAAVVTATTVSLPNNENSNRNENNNTTDGSWPYCVNSSSFNNYYAASLINDENIYQQFRAAALAAGVSLAPTNGNFDAACNNELSTTFNDNSVNFLQQIQLQQQSNTQQSLPRERQLLYIDKQQSTTVHIPMLLADCMIASSKLVLCGLTAYIEQSDDRRVELVKIPKVSDEPLESIKMEDIYYKYPKQLQDLFNDGPPDAFFLAKCWANVSFDMIDIERAALYSVDSYYNSRLNFEISVSTKVCSFGKQVVEKVEVYSPTVDDMNKGRDPNGENRRKEDLYEYRLEKSPMCDYMVRFIAELKKLDSAELMNSVLDNFTVLQIVKDRATSETLMVIAFIFEVSPEPESTCRMYRLTA